MLNSCMAELRFFQDRTPLPSEKILLKGASPEHLAFADGVLKIVGEVASRAGFERMLTHVEEVYTTVRFQRDDQGIKVFASTDYRDAPDHYNILLEAEIEGCWYSVALWHLKRVVAPGVDAREYPFPTAEGASESLRTAAAELELYGAAFLDGNLEVFEAARRGMGGN
jgi:hypothetical protein